jgi:hypothetical protein
MQSAPWLGGGWAGKQQVPFEDDKQEKQVQ